MHALCIAGKSACMRYDAESWPKSYRPDVTVAMCVHLNAAQHMHLHVAFTGYTNQ
jgi:hypothetical protein